IGNSRVIVAEGIGDLLAIGPRVRGRDALCRAEEVAIGVAHPELPHVPGENGERADDLCPSLLSLAIDIIDVLDEEDDLHTAAELPWWEQVWSLDFPVWRILCRQLEGGLPARQFSIFVCVASHDAKAQNALKPGDGLLEVAHTQLNPTCF